MKKISLVITVLIVACFSAQAQQSEGNPFARLDYKADVYTFGETKEFHDLEVVVEIGEVLFNTETNEVVGFIEDYDSSIELKPELQSMSIDPHCEKYYSISPYVYCMNNPVRFIDPDGKDVYGFDVNTGRLSLTQHTDDDYDRIVLGTYNTDNEFTINNENNFLDISKGVLLGDYFDNIAESGLVFSESLLSEGIKTMEFLSFNSNIEMSAWGYKTSIGEGLAISPWIFNETKKLNNTEYAMTSMDFYYNTERVGYLGDKIFNIHTHPGSKSGLGGRGNPSKKDFSMIKNDKYSYYILSKKDGITQYYPNGKWKRSGIKF